jgi:hypothetical protein
MNNAIVQPQAAINHVKLVDGVFTPSEAADILLDMFSKKINFHKLKILSINEGNHSEPCTYDHGRLEELIRQKAELEQIIRDVRSEGRNMKVNAMINIEIV